MTTKQYTVKDVQIGSQIITQDDLDLDLGWGTVNEIISDEDKVLATYKDGEAYEVEMWAVLDVRNATNTTPDPVDTSKSDDSSSTPAPATNTRDDIAQKAAALNVTPAKVAPGTIVNLVRTTANHRLTKGLDASRMWVVLNWTKNSNQTKVNIALVNGLQPGEKFSYSYLTVPVTSCRPINFKSYTYIKGGTN